LAKILCPTASADQGLDGVCVKKLSE